jgi:hypothetical protein
MILYPLVDLFRILPILVSNCDQAGAILFLRQLGVSNFDEEQTHETLLKPAYRALISNESTLVRVDLKDLVGNTSYSTTTYAPHVSQTPYVCNTTYDNFLTVLKYAISLELDEETRLLLSRGLPSVPAVSSTLWSNWRDIFASIDKLSKTIDVSTNNSNLSEIAQKFVSPALEAAAKWLLKHRPREPKTWSRHREDSCTCKPCKDLDRFLKNPTQVVGRFSYAEKLRKHLEYSLNYADYKFETEKTKAPYTLVIHKTKNGFSRLNARWKKDVAEMKSQLPRVWSGIASRNELGEKIPVPVGIEHVIQELV